MDFKDKIFHNIAESRSYTQKLKDMSEYYPNIKQDTRDETVYLTTLVRIERDGKWYTVHCVMSFGSKAPAVFVVALHRIMMEVHNIQYLYKITGTMEDLDILQQSETDRLLELIKKAEKKSEI